VLQPTLVNVNRIVTDMLPMLRSLLGERVEVAAALEVTPVWVRGDQAQLEQVLANLAVNARDAMPQGGRCTIRVAAVTLDAQGVAQYPDLRPGPYARLAVTDTGHGMSPEVLARVFDPFFTTKGVGKGTGLGLSMAHGLVAQHGGTIVVESEEGHGSIFTIYLPQAPPASSAGTV